VRTTIHRTHGPRRARLGLAASAATLLLLTGCGSDDSAAASDDTSASASASDDTTTGATGPLTVTDPWVKATDTEMTAAFGTFVNETDEDVTVVSASTDVAGLVELHEVVAGDDGATVMQPKEGGFTVPAEGTHELTAGGDHLMLMDLPAPLEAGDDVRIVLELSDGSTQDFHAIVKPFSGADEEYSGDMEMDMDDGSMDDMDMGDQ